MLKHVNEISLNTVVAVDENIVLQSLKTDFLMASFKRLYYVAEAAEKIMGDCNDEQDNTDVVIIPPENVDGMMDDEEISMSFL